MTMNGKKIEIHFVEDPTVDVTGCSAKTPKDAALLVRQLTKNAYKERFVFIALDAFKNVIGYCLVTEGTHLEAMAPVGDVIRVAALSGCVYGIIAHNHPGYTSKPSLPDVVVTGRMLRGLALIGVELLDHIVVGFKDDDVLSMRASGKFSDIWKESKYINMLRQLRLKEKYGDITN